MTAAQSDVSTCRKVAFTLNGKPVTADYVSDDSLADLLRDTLGLKGTKIGCRLGECGACTVVLDGRAICSCLWPAHRAQGCEITTIEGLGQDESSLSPLQEALYRKGAFQCGYCAPGMILSLTALFDTDPSPSEAAIRIAVQGNICRCSGYVRIVEAACQVAAEARP